ncbi:hypothetical protein PSAB6_80006 [Paraburkholderia sabiae]|uniref:hypothetical protein n=1 Tax=Paraburkholderia sabiae TaxID=273251 RepID=UPI001CAC1D2B|nr:hypothetical protein [Paraburkholderia sabiae]CAG9238666.1 hypothetical protein PSAB6_80006 [Paraburkholderia sabiae]
MSDETFMGEIEKRRAYESQRLWRMLARLEFLLERLIAFRPFGGNGAMIRSSILSSLCGIRAQGRRP